jgi:hypothetical protein
MISMYRSYVLDHDIELNRIYDAKIWVISHNGITNRLPTGFDISESVYGESAREVAYVKFISENKMVEIKFYFNIKIWFVDLVEPGIEPKSGMGKTLEIALDEYRKAWGVNRS